MCWGFQLDMVNHKLLNFNFFINISFPGRKPPNITQAELLVTAMVKSPLLYAKEWARITIRLSGMPGRHGLHVVFRHSNDSIRVKMGEHRQAQELMLRRLGCPQFRCRLCFGLNLISEGSG